MNRFSNEKDRTAQTKLPGLGLLCRRACWRCKQHVNPAGGAKDKRTGMWVCVGCKK